MTFRDILIEKRNELNLSIRAAAIKIGISHTYLTALEKGVDSRGLPAVNPTTETLKLISSAPDIRSLARAARKMNPKDIETLVKYAKFMFPEAFKDK